MREWERRACERASEEGGNEGVSERKVGEWEREEGGVGRERVGGL